VRCEGEEVDWERRAYSAYMHIFCAGWTQFPCLGREVEY
jgi:hypothetical protein